MEIAEDVSTGWLGGTGCEECEGVWLVTGEEVKVEWEGVMGLCAVPVEWVVVVTVSMTVVSVAEEGDPPLTTSGCELVRCVEGGKVCSCWGGWTGVKADLRDGYVNLLSNPASSLAWVLDEDVE